MLVENLFQTKNELMDKLWADLLKAMQTQQQLVLMLDKEIRINFESEYTNKQWPSDKIFDYKHWVSYHRKYLQFKESRFKLAPDFQIILVSKAEDENDLMKDI